MRRALVQRALRWLGEHTLAAILTATIGSAAIALAGFAVGQITGGKPPPLGDQLDAIRERTAEEGKYAVIDRSVELHGRGRSSQLFVFRPAKATEATVFGASDEVRIYDDDGGKLALVFRFQPKRDPAPYRFVVEGVGRFDETDRQEVLGQYVRTFADGEVPYPVVIVWDENLGAYRLRSLLPGPSELSELPNPGLWGRLAHKRYMRDNLRDTESEAVVAVYGSDYFFVRRKPFPILVAAFTLRAACNGCVHLSEVKAWRVNFQRPVPAIRPCAAWRKTLIQRQGPFDPVDVWLRQNPQARKFC